MKLKKYFSFIICLMLCAVVLCPCTGALAAEYKLANTGYSVSVSDDMYVFTRETPSDYVGFTETGLSYEGVMARFTLDNVYLYAMKKDSFEEFEISIENTNENNYYDQIPKDLTSVINAEKTAFVNITGSGEVSANAEAFKSGSGVNFVKVSCTGANMGRISYITVYNGQKINISYTNYDSEINAKDDEAFKALVNAVGFPKSDAPPKSEQPNDNQNAGQSGGLAEKENEASKSSAVNNTADDSTEGKNSLQFDGIFRIGVLVIGGLIVILLLVLIFGKRNRR